MPPPGKAVEAGYGHSRHTGAAASCRPVSKPRCLSVRGPKAGGEGGDKRMRGLDGITGSTDVSLSKLGEMVMDGQGGLPCAVHGTAMSQAPLN